ncbi:MarR family transcriptional regulator [Anaerosporobacter sp.]|uniref:MarR family transcriptional regulator n=1 Tax=Anaerosporobacter sp. TaxID=1872529 RepID=UPI00286FAA52|nr:MarR family transcriptional regulator [Anaerosporobacter sp.]
MNDQLLMQFAEFLEKQDLLSKLTEHEKLHEYGYSDIHTIAAIGDLEEPNVTEIAKSLNMTRGAVSKITKRLLSVGVIESYMLPDNKQKIFFRLTKSGEVLYKEHQTRHQKWIDRDNKFFSQFSSQQLEEISGFMNLFNQYLGEQIVEIGGDNNAN